MGKYCCKQITSTGNARETKQKKELVFYILRLFVVLVLIIIYTILRFYRTKQLRKENLLEQQTMENMQLKRQLDGSVDQIIELAKPIVPFS